MIRIIFHGIFRHLHIIKGNGSGFDRGVIPDQRAVHISVIFHGMTVISLWIDPGYNVPGIHFLRQPIPWDVLPVAQLHAVITAYAAVDHHLEVIKENFTAPAVDKTIGIISIQGLQEVFVLVIRRGYPGDIRPGGIFLIGRKHQVQRLLSVLFRGAHVRQPAAPHGVIKNRLHLTGDPGIRFFPVFDPEQLLPVKGRHLHNVFLSQVLPAPFRVNGMFQGSFPHPV